jgi:hypothetical protein
MPVSSQVVSSALPTAFEPFYKTGLTAAESPTGQAIKGLIPQAFGLYGTGTPASYAANIMDPLKAADLYSGENRVAGMTSGQQSVGTQLSAMQTPGQFAMGTGALGSGYLAASGLPSMLTPGQMQQYMSPYAQGVVDITKQKAIEDAQKTQLGENLAAARRGTYGGSRQLIAQTERERALGTQLSDIQSKGLQASYEAAQKGLESERAARLQQAQTLGTLGQQYGQLGIGQQATDLDRLKALGAYGDYERAVAQQKKDIDYANMMDRIRYPEMQMEKLSNFIRGIPTDTTTQTITPPPSFASQLAGLGLSGLSLYNLATK